MESNHNVVICEEVSILEGIFSVVYFTVGNEHTATTEEGANIIEGIPGGEELYRRHLRRRCLYC